MDAPPIQYARTEDGVNIAYWTLGKGPPLLYLRAVGTGSTAADFAFPPIARMYAELASTYSLLSLDFRNQGHSNHGIEHLALDDFVADIRAIVDATGLSRFAVFATGWSAPVAIRYATRHAAQVSHLILNAPVVQGPHGPTAHDAVTGLWPLDPAAAASAFATAQGLDDPNLMAWLESFLDDPDPFDSLDAFDGEREGDGESDAERFAPRLWSSGDLLTSQPLDPEDRGELDERIR